MRSILVVLPFLAASFLHSAHLPGDTKPNMTDDLLSSLTREVVSKHSNGRMLAFNRSEKQVPSSSPTFASIFTKRALLNDVRDYMNDHTVFGQQCPGSVEKSHDKKRFQKDCRIVDTTEFDEAMARISDNILDAVEKDAGPKDKHHQAVKNVVITIQQQHTKGETCPMNEATIPPGRCLCYHHAEDFAALTHIEPPATCRVMRKLIKEVCVEKAENHPCQAAIGILSQMLSTRGNCAVLLAMEDKFQQKTERLERELKQGRVTAEKDQKKQLEEYQAEHEKLKHHYEVKCGPKTGGSQ